MFLRVIHAVRKTKARQRELSGEPEAPAPAAVPVEPLAEAADEEHGVVAEEEDEDEGDEDMDHEHEIVGHDEYGHGFDAEEDGIFFSSIFVVIVVSPLLRKHTHTHTLRF